MPVMEAFTYKKNQLHCESVSMEELAQTYGTPLYVYSETAFRSHYKALDKAFSGVPHLICYSVKTNSNLSVIKVLADEGAGADVVSGGELVRALKAGIKAKNIVFAGVGKTREEMALGIQKGIYMFNAESVAELSHLDQVAAGLKKKTGVALRVNPDVKPVTHKKITTGHKESKFGIPFEEAKAILGKFKANYPNLNLLGIHCHIGSQLLDPKPYVQAIEKSSTLIPLAQAGGNQLETFNLGGGFGIKYKPDQQPPTFQDFADAMMPALKATGLRILMEPGRSIAGNAGVLLTRVMYSKQSGKRYVIVDSAMNDLIRPAMYEAYHEVVPVIKSKSKTSLGNLVGPVCETGDVLAEDRELPQAKEGDLFVLLSAGAYGMAMASNYNTRPKAAEVMVKGNQHRLIRKRESLADLMKHETPYLGD